LLQFLFHFEYLFRSATRNVSSTALIYLKGLLLCHRRNCQVMSEELQQSNQQQLHHFITAAKWQCRLVMDTVTMRFWQLLEQCDLQADSCLIIDEAGNPKKGRQSAGVKRQYCGQTGKIDNCQVGVFGAICGGSLVNLVQGILFGAGRQGSKIDHARTIITHVVKELKIKVSWVCFDAFYGRDSGLLCWLVQQKIEFVADVQDNLKIWLESFQMRIPVQQSGVRGRKNKLYKPNRPSIALKAYVESLHPRDWKFICVRHQSNGRRLKAWFHSREVYIINPLTNRRQLVTLLIREDGDGTIKYSFCHCPGCSLKQLAYRQCKRYFVEKAFREAKKELGLNEYQTRSEESWNRHMAMIMLAQLFLNEEKILFYEHERLWMTTNDIIQSLKSILLFVKRSIEKMLEYILAKQPPDKHLVHKCIFMKI
jgi:SRSO17 transposase